MEGWPKQFSVLTAQSPIHCLKRHGSGWYAMHAGECVYALEEWAYGEYDPTLVVQTMCRMEELDPRATVFYELCLAQMYDPESTEPFWYRKLALAFEAESDDLYVAYGYTLEKCNPIIQEAFGGVIQKLTTTEEPIAQEEEAELKFHEVAYFTPKPRGPGEEICFALYVMVDRCTCIFTRAMLAEDEGYYWEHALPIIRAIIEQWGLIDPTDALFYDATPNKVGWARVTISKADAEEEYTLRMELDLPPHPYMVERIQSELAEWRNYIVAGDSDE